MIYECVISNQSSTVRLPVLETIEGSRRNWRVWLKEDPGEASAPVDLTTSKKALFVAKETPRESRIYIKKEMEIRNPPEGYLFLELLPGDVHSPGLWYGVVQLFDKEDYLNNEIPCRLMVNKSITSTSSVNPLTVAEVREFLMDRCPEDNRLLFDTQFTDEQIINAMVLPIEEWNDTPPFIERFTPVTFPWHRPLTIGTASYLLESQALNQLRNQANYQTGNVTVNDSDKGGVFLEVAEKLRGEWQTWLVAKKRELNNRMGWGSSSIRGF